MGENSTFKNIAAIFFIRIKGGATFFNGAFISIYKRHFTSVIYRRAFTTTHIAALTGCSNRDVLLDNLNAPAVAVIVKHRLTHCIGVAIEMD